MPATLRKSLKNRHIQLIALGGAIGTGLFYGSSESIALAGPSILLAYLIGGLAIFMIDARAEARCPSRIRRRARSATMPLATGPARRLHLRLELTGSTTSLVSMVGLSVVEQIRKLLVPGDSDLGVGSRIP